ncbi:carbon-nitrogen hydrolase family protein [Telmatospirillum sp. J64-1]|uniref:carbon-nitrogen hydrolase family protein n=1 Tax=Telmatospirillum sp. J64-1 TaxID=2502183 RepID=UPI00115C924A|nr:carbon-nitrogen hydrolase family protein [Telmatospirillum sp. J64-1]
MSQRFKAACIQVNALNDMQANIQAAGDLVRRARDAGADLVLMPENVAMMEWGRANILAKSQPESEHAALAAFRELARETGAWLHCGTLAIRLPGDMVANRSYVLDPTGEIAAWYDKIHMFDVCLPGGETYRESATFQPGDRAVVARTPWGGLGLTICYDLRFPYLFRSLAHAGADFLATPAAFTRTTGMAHWHVLQRARAIETGCYVFAPAQCGTHINDRQTYGHALIVAPWGEVLADAGEEPGFVIAEIDTARVAEARQMVPALTHDRSYHLAEEAVPAE